MAKRTVAKPEPVVLSDEQLAELVAKHGVLEQPSLEAIQRSVQDEYDRKVLADATFDYSRRELLTKVREIYRAEVVNLDTQAQYEELEKLRSNTLLNIAQLEQLFKSVAKPVTTPYSALLVRTVLKSKPDNNAEHNGDPARFDNVAVQWEATMHKGQPAAIMQSVTTNHSVLLTRQDILLRQVNDGQPITSLGYGRANEQVIRGTTKPHGPQNGWMAAIRCYLAGSRVIWSEGQCAGYITKARILTGLAEATPPKGSK